MRMLIFCGTRNAVERFDAAGVPIIVALFPQPQRAEIIKTFIANPDGCLAVDRCMVHGWRAPADTFILFDPSWPFPADHPMSIQATSRRATPYMERAGKGPRRDGEMDHA